MSKHVKNAGATLSPWRRAAIVEDLRSGLSAAEVARRNRSSHFLVCTIRDAEGIAPHPRGGTRTQKLLAEVKRPDVVAALLAAYDEEIRYSEAPMTMAELCRNLRMRFGRRAVSSTTAWRIIRRNQEAPQ